MTYTPNTGTLDKSNEITHDGIKVWNVLAKRLEKYGLNLHGEKSRLMPSGRKAGIEAGIEGWEMPVFQFLGFTCY